MSNRKQIRLAINLLASGRHTAELKGAVIDPAQALVIAAALGLVVRED